MAPPVSSNTIFVCDLPTEEAENTKEVKTILCSKQKSKCFAATLKFPQALAVDAL